MNTNEIIAYDLTLRPNLEQISRMLEKAFKKFTDLSGLIFILIKDGNTNISTLGEHFKEHGIIQSMSRKGNCYDNSEMETFLVD